MGICTGPELEFHKVILHPNFYVQAMGLFFCFPLKIGVSHYLRPVLNSKFIFYGTMDICTGPNWGFTLVKKACTSSKIPFTGPNWSFTIFECTSSKNTV